MPYACGCAPLDGPITGEKDSGDNKNERANPLNPPRQSNVDGREVVTGVLDFEFSARDWRVMELVVGISKYAGAKGVLRLARDGAHGAHSKEQEQRCAERLACAVEGNLEVPSWALHLRWLLEKTRCVR